MHLTLLVPGLLWPRGILRDTTFDLPLPALARLLGRGRRLPITGEAAWLAETFGIAAPMPTAPLRLLGQGGVAADHDWLCLDPVHMRTTGRAIMLDDPARLHLDADEDAALRAAVAPLFAPLGEIVAPVPGQWHLRLSRPALIETTDLPANIGLEIDPALPGGTEGTAWRRLLAEAQPVLHAHPVNRRRDADGRPTVSSLWPWGGGRLPAARPHRFRTTWGADPVLRGLATLNGMLVEPLPPRFTVARGSVLARYDTLLGSLSGFDAASWRAGLTDLEAAWLAPALSAVQSGVLRRLTLVASGHDQAIEVTLGRRDLWRFWRRPLDLANLAP